MTAHPDGAGGPVTPNSEEIDRTLQELVLDSQDVAGFLTDLAVVAATRLSMPGSPVHAGCLKPRVSRPLARLRGGVFAH